MCKVLVVDDQLPTRAALCVSLRRYGLKVTAVGSIMDAQRSLQTLNPDVVICAPAADSEDRLDLIQEMCTLIPAIALITEPGEERQARSVGFQACFHKPVDPEELGSTVRELARRQKLSGPI